MKKKSLLWISALLLMLAGCSSNDDEFNEPNNSAPEFAEGTGENPRYTGNKTTTSSNGVEITKDAQGSIRWIIFTDEEKAPTSAISLFSQYLGCNLEKDYRHYRQENYDKLIVEFYQQQYNGVIIYQAGYNVRFQNGKVTDCNGVYIKIDNLDVTPAFDLQRAKEIYAKYLKVSVEEIGRGGRGITVWFDDALMIAEFPVSKGSSQWAPRLVYALAYIGEKNYGMHDEGSCFIDAHTGRILQTWPNYILD